MDAKLKTWDEAVDCFVAWMRVEEKSPSTVRCYSDDLQAFADWCESATGTGPKLSQLGKSDLVEWKQSLVALKRAPATVNRKLAAVASFLRWARNEGLCDPIGSPKKMRCGRQPPKWLTKNEKHAFLRTVEKAGKRHHLEMVTLVLNTGLRVSEMAGLKWYMVKMKERKGTIEVEGKGRKQRTISLNSDAMNALRGLGWREYKDKDRLVFPMTVRGIQFIITKYGRRAELDLSAHMLRHTFAHDMLAAGNPLTHVQEMMGHESPVTTALYLTASAEELAAAVERISLEGEEPDEPEPPKPRKRR
jgi:site-specific recombinase XerD